MHDGVDAPLSGSARKLGALPQIPVDAADVDVASGRVAMWAKSCSILSEMVTISLADVRRCSGA